MLSGRVAPVVGTTNIEPIVATEREHVYNADRLLLGAYCFPKDGNYDTLRQWFKEAGLEFFVGSWGGQFTPEDFQWMEENGVGFFAPNTEYYRSAVTDSIWGIDYRDEPAAQMFDDLAAGVKELYELNPSRLPLVNLFPMYANDEQLGETSEVPGSDYNTKITSFNRDDIEYRMHVSDYIGKFDSDVISVDIYPLNIEDGKLTTYNKWLRNLDILAEACRETGRDLWVVTQAAGNVIEEQGSKRHCDTVGDQRWQNYVSLAFGAKAIIYACYYTGWWDGDSHMIDNSGERTPTYYAVQRVNQEMAVFADVYGNYENHGAVLYNRANPNCAGAWLNINAADEAYRPLVVTAAPLLTGCFTEKEGDGRAFVFANMYEPQTGKTASFTAVFPGAERITVYRKGVTIITAGNRLSLKLANEEGVFVTVDYGK